MKKVLFLLTLFPILRRERRRMKRERERERVQKGRTIFANVEMEKTRADEGKNDVFLCFPIKIEFHVLNM